MTDAPAVPMLLDVPVAPQVRAAFTTRFGGVSPAPWESLNLGLNVGDDPVRVRQNRSRVAKELGRPVVYMEQVHGDHVAVIGDDWRGEVIVGVDALVTARTDVALAVLVADCVPILVADPVQGLTAAIHAGRRGVELDIVTTAVAKLRQLGACELTAVIGPSICGRCYEVPESLRAEVAAGCPQAYATTSRGTAALDLPAAVRAQLARAEVRVAVQQQWCTLEDERFFSHRSRLQSGTQTTGRCAGLIGLR